MLITIILYVALVAAWNIFSGFTGYLFLGVAAFYGIAGYFFATISNYVPYLLAIPMVGVVCFIIGYLIGIVFLRIRGPYFAIASFALVLLISNIILYYEQVVTRVSGRVVTFMPLKTIYMVLLGITIITLIVAYVIRKSRFGFSLACIKGNEDLANVIGIDTSRVKRHVFGICAFFIGIITSSVIPRGGYIDTTIVFNPTISFNVFVMGVVGGIGSLRGGVLSTVFLSVLFQVFMTRENPYPFFVFVGILLMLVIFFYPKGVEGILEAVTKNKGPR